MKQIRKKAEKMKMDEIDKPSFTGGSLDEPIFTCESALGFFLAVKEETVLRFVEYFTRVKLIKSIRENLETENTVYFTNEEWKAYRLSSVHVRYDILKTLQENGYHEAKWIPRPKTKSKCWKNCKIALYVKLD